MESISRFLQEHGPRFHAPTSFLRILDIILIGKIAIKGIISNFKYQYIVTFR